MLTRDSSAHEAADERILGGGDFVESVLGAIRLDVGTISGSGSLRARGGAGGTSGAEGSGGGGGGGGGGGRIALIYNTNALSTANLLAHGGRGFDGSDPLRNGGAGTVYLKGSAAAVGDLTIDNNGLDSRADSTVLESLGLGTVSILTSTSLTGDGANWAPASMVGKARVYCGEQIKVINALLIDNSSLLATNVNAGTVETNNGGTLAYQ